MRKYSSYFITTVLAFLALSFNFKNVSDCSRVKNGKFYYYSKISGDKVDIERYDNTQLETNTKNGHILKNKIIWKGDCNYDMYINALSNSKLEKMDSLIAATRVSVEIIRVDSSYYVCQWRMNFLAKELGEIDTIYFKNN